MLFRYAFRNISRHRGRSALTIVAVALAVGLVTLAHALLVGFEDNLIHEFTRQSGHVRLRTHEYSKNERFEPLFHTIEGVRQLRDRLLATDGVRYVAPRTRFGIIVQYTDRSMIVPEDQVEDESLLTDEQIFGRMVSEFGLGIAVDPETERKVDNISTKIVEGTWFENFNSHVAGTPAEDHESENPVVIGAELARKLNVKPGDEVQLVTYRGALVIAKARVTGIFDYGNKVANRACYLPTEVAERLLDMPDQATTLLIFGDTHRDTDALMATLAALPWLGHLEIKPWNQIGLFRVIYQIFSFVVGLLLVIVVVVAGIGLLNTMLMSVLERQREIGVLLALGLRRSRVVTLFLLEALVFAILGGIAGGMVGIGASLYFVEHGLQLGADAGRNLPIALSTTIHAVLTPQAIVLGFGIGFLVAIIGAVGPAFRASGVDPALAMRKA